MDINAQRLAIGGLANLAVDDANKPLMWADAAVRGALMAACSNADDETRREAFRGLANRSNDAAIMQWCCDA